MKLALFVFLSSVGLYAQGGQGGGQGGSGSSVAQRVITGSGVPSSGTCNSAASVGKVYLNKTAASANSSLYTCDNTGVGTYAWELGGGAGGGATIAAGTGITISPASPCNSGTCTINASGATGGPAYTTVSFSATPAFAVGASTNPQNFQITLTGNVTSSTLTTTSATRGQDIAFKVCQDATGSRTFTWPTNVVNPGSVPTTASVCGKQIFRWDGTNAVAFGGMVSDGGTPGVWTPSGFLAFPTGTDTLVDLAGTQLLTNKTIDGVTPTTMGFVDPTSSIQTQINSKGVGSVTSVSITPANGVSGTVASPTTTPAISLTLGAITPTSVAATTTVTAQNIGSIYNAAQYGWIADGTDHSTQALALLTTACANNSGGGGTIFFPAIVSASTAGTAGSGSTSLTVASGTGLAVGQVVAGAGITNGTTLASGSGTSWTLSLPTTAILSSASLVFTLPYRADSQLMIPVQSGTNYGCNLRFTGAGGGTVWEGSSLTAAVLDLRYQGNSGAKIEGQGQGTLTLDHLTLEDLSIPPSFSVTGGTLTNIVVSSNVATATFASTLNNGSFAGATWQISGSTTTALNGFYDLTSVTGTTVVFPTVGIANGTYNNGALTMSYSANFVHASGTTVSASNNNFVNNSPSQYAFTFGGNSATGTGPNGTFNGYGTVIGPGNSFLGPGMYARTYMNDVLFTGNTFVRHGQPGSFALILCNGSQSTVDANQNWGLKIKDNTVEMDQAVYGVYLNACLMGEITGNSFYDDGAQVINYVQFTNGSIQNLLSFDYTLGTHLYGDDASGATYIKNNIVSAKPRTGAHNYNTATLTAEIPYGASVFGSSTPSAAASGYECEFNIGSIVDTTYHLGLCADSTNGMAIDAVRVGVGSQPLTINHSGGPVTFQSYTNDGSTGTTANKLVVQNGSNQVIRASTATTDGVVGIAIAGAGTTGSVEVATVGQASCVFDGATTLNDWVQVSATTAGDCHDSGVSPPSRPTTGQIIGLVNSTNGGAGTYLVSLQISGPNGSGGASVPCTTTALSLQYDNAGSFGCVPDFTFSTPHTIVGGPSGILDLHSAANSGFLLPGGLSTGLVAVTTSTGAISSQALGTGVAAALGTNVSGSGAICLATGSVCSSGGGLTGTSVTSVTPVTANANSTSDQALMELALGAGYLNAKQPFMFNGAGVYSTQTLQTPTLTFKVKLCTISGCGSGTVVTLVSIVSTASLAAATNQNWNLSFMGYTATTGATGNLEIHGPLVVDLGATTATADSIFSDTNTAVSSNIDLTAALFVDFTVTFSTQPTTPFNSCTQRSGGIMPFAATAAPVTSVAGDGLLYSSAPSVGAAALTPLTIAAHKFIGNNTGSTAAYGAQSIGSADLPANVTVRSYGGGFGGGTTALITGTYSLPITIPIACTIIAWDISIQKTDTGTATVKFVKVATGTGSPGSGNEINTSGVSLASGTHVHSTTLTDFTTTAVSANDVLAVTITTIGGSPTGLSATVQCQSN